MGRGYVILYMRIGVGNGTLLLVVKNFIFGHANAIVTFNIMVVLKSIQGTLNLLFNAEQYLDLSVPNGMDSVHNSKLQNPLSRLFITCIHFYMFGF